MPAVPAGSTARGHAQSSSVLVGGLAALGLASLDASTGSRRRQDGVARGVTLIRYADDFVLLIHNKEDVPRVMSALAKRLERFGLRLHPDKTR
ncbi:MAG: hypothetical protein KA151_13235, partial [Piscinibacter sp.]|nr:hypothetical protein [Piscinibacter sp.]